MNHIIINYLCHNGFLKSLMSFKHDSNYQEKIDSLLRKWEVEEIASTNNEDEEGKDEFLSLKRRKYTEEFG